MLGDYGDGGCDRWLGGPGHAPRCAMSRPRPGCPSPRSRGCSTARPTSRRTPATWCCRRSAGWATRRPAGAASRARPGRAVYVRCPYVLTDYFGLIVSSIAETIELHGRQMMLNAGEAAQRQAVLPALADRPDVAGAILILPPEPPEATGAAARPAVPVRGRRPAHAAAARHRRRLGRALRRRAPADDAPGRARPPPGRHHRRAAASGWPTTPGWPGTPRRWPTPGCCRRRS